MKLKIYESNYLFEDIEAVKKYYPSIDDDIFMQLISLDPTYRDGSNSVGKYGKWILNLFKKGAISKEDFSEITPLLKQFTTYKNRVQNKDLNSYKTLDDLSDTLAQVVDDDSMLSDRQKLRFKKNVKAGRVSTEAEDDYDVVFEDSQYIVYVPNTHEASMKLGKGTKWCTAHENRDWYDNYTQDGGKLYIIKNKQTGDRWQYSDKTEDFLDETDSIFDVMTLLESDNSLRNFFIKSIFNLPEDGLYVIKNEYDGRHIPKFVQELRISTDLDNVNLSGNTNIVSIVLDEGITYIPHRSFANCIRLKNISIPNTVKGIGLQVFENCQSLEKIIIPDSVLQIKNGVFSGCRNLKYVKLPNELDKLPSDLFSYCESLKDVRIPILHTGEIGNRVFQQCISLTSIDLPNNLTIVGEAAFSDCSSLISITIPNTVEYIKEDAFYNCPKLTVYTDSEYAKEYCEENNTPCDLLSSAKTESLKLRIKEDTACIASKTSYMDEDGLDANGIYYFGDKPNLPTNWRKVFKKRKNVKQIKERCNYMKLRINESVDFDNIVDKINGINTSDISSSDKVNQITEILRTMKNDYVIDLARNEKSGSNHFIKVGSMWVDADAGCYSYSNYDIADEIVNGRLRLVVDIWDKSKARPLSRGSNRKGFLDDATKDRKNYGQKDGFYGI